MNIESIQLDNNFLQEEVRCEYSISEKQKRIWAVELDLLNRLLAVCKKYDIQVVAFAGTLLGTVRHKGFIPWDDDVDVCMTRENFEKMLGVAEIEFKKPYFLQTAYSDPEFFCPYARLRNSSTTGIITGHNSANYNNGIYIDVFVLDGLCEDEQKYHKQMRQLKYASLLFNWSVSSGSLRSRLIRMLRSGIYHIFSFRSLVEFYNKILERYTDGSSKLSLITHGIYNNGFDRKYWLSKSDLEDIVELDFEMIRIPVPRNFDEILSHIYGDYMKFPPIEDRGKWHEGEIEFDPDTPYLDFLRQKGII